jgi:hypothetical protein
VVTKQLLAYLNGRAAYVRPFFREIVVTADKNEQSIIEGDYAAKIVASIIIAGILPVVTEPLATTCRDGWFGCPFPAVARREAPAVRRGFFCRAARWQCRAPEFVLRSSATRVAGQ